MCTERVYARPSPVIAALQLDRHGYCIHTCVFIFNVCTLIYVCEVEVECANRDRGFVYSSVHARRRLSHLYLVIGQGVCWNSANFWSLHGERKITLGKRLSAQLRARAKPHLINSRISRSTPIVLIYIPFSPRDVFFLTLLADISLSRGGR